MSASLWGCSSVGRALDWQSRGQGFDPPQLHQPREDGPMHCVGPFFFVLRPPMRVILVHGYLAPSSIFWPLARRLRHAGHDVESFDYPSRRGRLIEHADGLIERIEEFPGRNTAIVAHSMGGLLVQVALSRSPAEDVTRRVFIATPLNGSRAARTTAQSPIGRFISPAARRTGWGVRSPVHGAQTGVVVGTRDRLVQPHETAFTGAHDRLELPFGHNELLLRRRTAWAVATFLARGRFDAVDV